MKVRNTGNTPIHIAGFTIAPNHTLELEDSEWERWLGAGSANRQAAATIIKIERLGPPSREETTVADAMPAPPPPPAPASGTEQIAERRDALMQAIPSIPTDDADNWTQDGMPTLQALRTAAALGDITREERDQVWQEYAERHL